MPDVSLGDCPKTAFLTEQRSKSSKSLDQGNIRKILTGTPPICGGTNGDVLIFPLDVPLIQSYLVGGAITILKNDGVCQWVSDDIPYMKWKIQNS